MSETNRRAWSTLRAQVRRLSEEAGYHSVEDAYRAHTGRPPTDGWDHSAELPALIEWLSLVLKHRLKI